MLIKLIIYNNMKKILTLLAIGIVGLTSCKKESPAQQNFFLMQLWDYEYASDEWQGDPIKAFGDSEKSVYIQAQSYSGNQYDLPQFTWSVSCDKDWCHYEYSGGSSLLTLRFTCDDNTTGNSRTAILTVNAGEESLKIGVEQLGTPSVTVSTPGTLTQELANKDLLYATSLKISGRLNDKDLETIKGLRKVETLDLTEAIIDDLPDGMYYQNETIKSIKLPETITTIHSKTFAFSSLEYIYFPSNIEVIEDGNYNNSYNWSRSGAFANTNLRTIEFASDSKLRYIGDYAFVAAGEEYYSSYSNTYSYTFDIIFPASVEEIGSDVFSYNSRGNTVGVDYESRTAYIRIAFAKNSELTSIGSISNSEGISIDASNCAKVKYVGSLSGFDNSISVKIGTQTPPQCGGVSLSSSGGGHAYLYVPKGCVGAYYEADGWKEFDTIKEIE